MSRFSGSVIGIVLASFSVMNSVLRSFSVYHLSPDNQKIISGIGDEM